MRGPREVVAKALALECMRAAKAQERGCYVFAFAGPQEVGVLPARRHAPCLVLELCESRSRPALCPCRACL